MIRPVRQTIFRRVRRSPTGIGRHEHGIEGWVPRFSAPDVVPGDAMRAPRDREDASHLPNGPDRVMGDTVLMVGRPRHTIGIAFVDFGMSRNRRAASDLRV